MSVSTSALAGQRILVTGASGFLGHHLCRRLTSSGEEVHAISRSHFTSGSGELTWWQGDLAEISKTEKILAAVKPHLIFHLASHVAAARGLDLVMRTFRSNLMSTVNLLTVATKIGCRRILLAGSLEEPDSGDSQTIPSSPYAAAKAAASAYARMFHALYQAPVVVLRIFMVYGPAQRDLQKLVPYVTLSLLSGRAPKLQSGRRLVDWIYVEDVVEGLLAAASAPNVEGRTIDLGSGTLVNTSTVVEYLVRLIDPRIKPLFGALPDRPLEQERVADVATTSALTGWAPTTSLQEGLERTVRWYAEQVREGVLFPSV